MALSGHDGKKLTRTLNLTTNNNNKEKDFVNSSVYGTYRLVLQNTNVHVHVSLTYQILLALASIKRNYYA